MDSITLGLDEERPARLAERAARAGVSPEVLAADVLAEFLAEPTSGESIEFVGTFSSEELRGDRVDELLAEGFGR